MSKNKEINKDDLIKKAKRKIKSGIAGQYSGNTSIINQLIDRAAFLLTEIEMMETDLKENGWTESFSQSPNMNPYEKERAVARQYLLAIKSYNSVIKQIYDIIYAKNTPNNVNNNTNGTKNSLLDNLIIESYKK